MSEETVIRCCASTLAAIKTGSLFNCPVESQEELTENLRMVNRCLIHKDVRAFPLRYQNGRALIYLYRPQMLERDLQNLVAEDILRKNGYDFEFDSLHSHHLQADQESPGNRSSEAHVLWGSHGRSELRVAESRCSG